MTAQQSAALAMLDELRGLFATGALADARRLGGGVLAELATAFAVTTIVPEAAIGGRPVVRDAGELATLCELAHAQFASDPDAARSCVRQVLQLAADLNERLGDVSPRAPHELRDDGGRTIAFAEVEPRGFEMIELPVLVLHPAARAAAAARLGITVDELRALEPTELATRLAAASIPTVRAIPKIRRDALPPRYFLPRDRFAGRTFVDDPLASEYQRLGALIERHAYYITANAPAPIIAGAAGSLQGVVDDIAAAAATPFEPHDAWVSDGPSETYPPYRGPSADNPYDGPPRIVWLTDDRIAIVRHQAVSIIALRDGRVIHTLPLGWGDRVTTCDDSGRYLLVAGQFMAMLACIDTETGRWVDAIPDDVPAVSYHKNDADVGYEEDGSDELFVFELRRTKAASFAGEWATPLAWARGNRAVLIGDNFDRIGTHGIRSTQSMLELVSSDTLAARAVDAPTLRSDGTFRDADVTAAMTERWTGRFGEPRPCAIAEVDGRWRMLLPTLHVCDVEQTWFRIGFELDAASFSPDGRRLAVLGDALHVIDIATRAISAIG